MVGDGINLRRELEWASNIQTPLLIDLSQDMERDRDG